MDSSLLWFCPVRMIVRPLCRFILSTLLLIHLPGCALFAPKPPPPPAEPPKPRPPYVWDAQKVQTERGSASLVVDLSDQRVYLYKGEILVAETKCSSGK